MQCVARNEVRTTNLLSRALLSPKIDKDGTTTYPVACFDIIKDVTDKPGRLEIKIKVFGGSQQNARLWFPAVTAHSKLWDTTRPLITQVSRFGNWKNPWQVIDVYRQVALVGAMEAADDIKAMDILKEIQEKAAADPDVHLLYDPAVIKHPEVNAFQRFSSVILQRSICEGFGLTVTEAMWKEQPVVGTSVTGLRAQIIDGQNCYIADSTEACAQRTFKLIKDRELWRELGKQAHEHVRKHYLFPAMVLQYLDALTKAREMSRNG